MRERFPGAVLVAAHSHLNEGERAAAWLAAQSGAAWLAKHNLRMPELVLDNGSGLSRRERISAESLARLLVAALSRIDGKFSLDRDDFIQ